MSGGQNRLEVKSGVNLDSGGGRENADSALPTDSILNRVDSIAIPNQVANDT